MEKALLANNLSTTAIVLIVVFCVLAAGSFLYGVIRKFSRMSWAGWQIVLLFFASFLFAYLPADGDKTLLFALAAGGFLAVVALVLGLGALIRRAIRNHGKYGMGFNAFDRIFGGISALLDWVVFFAAFGGFALACLEIGGTDVASVGEVLSSPVWKFLSGHIVDLLLIAFLVLAVKGGYRLGFARSILALVGVALTLAAFGGAVALTFRVGFLRRFAGTIAGAFPESVNPIIATLVGNSVVVILCFLVLFAVAALLLALVNLLVKKMNRHTGFNVFDGCVLALVFYLIAVAVVCGVHFGVSALAGGALAEYESFGETVTRVAVSLETVLRSSPMSGLLYACNPLRLLAG
ncbi:MAG: hypothetical protein ACI4ST_03095 [Candidatus Gallimonas sp.]